MVATDKITKVNLLDRMVDRYCVSYLKTTKNGRCDGKCPFKGLCSTDSIKKNCDKVEDIFESMRKKKLEEILHTRSVEDGRSNSKRCDRSI